MSLKFGKISYINSVPLFSAPMPEGFDLVTTNPGELNTLVREKVLDVSLISRWIYKSIKDDYRVLPQYCIAGAGTVMSVKLFSKYEISALGDKKVYITSETGSSSRAFRHISLKRFGYDLFSCKTSDIAEADAILLIGDKALAHKNTFQYEYDLGELWEDFCKLPMIYSVCVIRKNLPKSVDENFADYFEKSLEIFAEKRGELVDGAVKMLKASTGITLEKNLLDKYYDCLKYKLDAADFNAAFDYVEHQNIA